ncbi:MAG: CDP-glycerol glycerophosphotransferase family protein [Bacilli bacterium]|jgi:CDP-glycerol glycerophosphotransferase
MKKIIKNILSFLFSFLKIKKKIILESYPDFSDNTKALFDYMVKKKLNEEYQLVWLINEQTDYSRMKVKNTKFVVIWNKDNRISLIRRIKLFITIGNAKYLITSNRALFKINRKTISIYLMHGFPIKKVKDLKIVPPNIDYVLTTSERNKKIVAKQLNLSEEKMIVLGSPRNDLLYLNEERKREVLRKTIGLKDTFKTIIWLPTFRQQRSRDRVDSTYDFPFGIPIIYNNQSLMELDHYLEQMKIRIVLKLHPAENKNMKEQTKNIILINDDLLIKNNIHLYEFIGAMDSLITDYSSVYTDFLMLDRQIAFTIDDFEDYNKGRGFTLENPKKYMPGVKIKDLKDFKKYIKDFSQGKDQFKKERKIINNFFNNFNDNLSRQRIVDFLINKKH